MLEEFPNQCDQLTTGKMNTIVCRCDFDFCNGHKIAIGPGVNDRYYQVPYKPMVDSSALKESKHRAREEASDDELWADALHGVKGKLENKD